ncbi:hypothetical protein KQY30_20065 [Streptomyces sp. GMY02]|uniref:DUF7736 domain-containing protein n=1 Tax=Streptomyces sp. GMY02 TaxID=1333528 RepID=UPI001C2B9BBC|nr:hypothetical protein [Streptomyces sp. GMY02]QXE36196.1 hypothetical protein KQY30_20065 [Streptomyces sp. GMY02]
MTTRLFPLADVLSVTTRWTLTTNPSIAMEAVCAVLGHMTGQSVYLHQAPDIADACVPELIEQHPFLADLVLPDDRSDAVVMAWLAKAERVHGTEIEVTPINDWRYRDPIEDAADMAGVERVWVVRPDER